MDLGARRVATTSPEPGGPSQGPGLWSQGRGGRGLEWRRSRERSFRRLWSESGAQGQAQRRLPPARPTSGPRPPRPPPAEQRQEGSWPRSAARVPLSQPLLRPQPPAPPAAQPDLDSTLACSSQAPPAAWRSTPGPGPAFPVPPPVGPQPRKLMGGWKGKMKAALLVGRVAMGGSQVWVSPARSPIPVCTPSPCPQPEPHQLLTNRTQHPP